MRDKCSERHAQPSKAGQTSARANVTQARTPNCLANKVNKATGALGGPGSVIGPFLPYSQRHTHQRPAPCRVAPQRQHNGPKEPQRCGTASAPPPRLYVSLNRCRQTVFFTRSQTKAESTNPSSRSAHPHAPSQPLSHPLHVHPHHYLQSRTLVPENRDLPMEVGHVSAQLRVTATLLLQNAM